MANATEIGEIIKLYVGYYNRAPDPLGLDFWIEAFDNGFSLDDMAEDFSTQPETLANYPFFENEAPSDEDYGTFVDSVYQNLFNRDPDAAGRAFWVEKLGSGEFSVGQAISLIIEGATTSPDQDVVANKVEVGRDFYNDVSTLPPYTFDQEDVDAATAIQASVTENPASVVQAAALTDAYVVSESTGPSLTINLTAETDAPGGTVTGADTQGGSGDDVYSGTVAQSGRGTLQNSDSIAAGGGEDTLNIRLVREFSDNLSETTTLAASDLEAITVTNQLPGVASFLLDLEATTGEQVLTAVNGNADGTTVFGNVDVGTLIRMVDVEGKVGVDFKGDQAATTDDAFALEIENAGKIDQFATFALTEDGFDGQEEGFEMLSLAVDGSQASFLNLEGLALTDIVVTGTQHVHLSDAQDLFEELNTLDARAMTDGGVSIDAFNADVASTFTFMGSDFDDQLGLESSRLATGSFLSLDGGAGIDTLAVLSFDSGPIVSAVNQATNFEMLEFFRHTTSLEASAYTDIDTFILNQTADGGRLALSGVESDDLFVFNTDAGRTDEFIQFEAETVGQSLTFELRATVEDEGNIELVASGNNNGSSAIGFTGDNTFSEVTIHSTGTNEDANLITAIDSGSGAHYAFDNSDGPTNFLITGNQALTITAAEGVQINSGDDALGFTDSVIVDGSAATGDLRVAGSSVNDRIEGGMADDILYGLGGDDILIGNGGADQFRFTNWTGTDEILDFTSGEDVIGLRRTEFQNTTASVEGEALNSEDYIENIQSIANITNAENEKLVELQSAASQTQISQTESSAAVEAYVLVFNSTSGEAELWYDQDWSDSSNRSHTATIGGVNDVTELVGFSNTDFVEYLF